MVNRITQGIGDTLINPTMSVGGSLMPTHRRANAFNQSQRTEEPADFNRSQRTEGQCLNRIPPTAVGGSLIFNLARGSMLIESLQTISWAYQLHYYLCFRTRRCRSVFIKPEHADALNAALREICQRHNYHLLQSKVYPDHLRCLLSLRPEQTISSVIRTDQSQLSAII